MHDEGHYCAHDRPSGQGGTLDGAILRKCIEQLTVEKLFRFIRSPYVLGTRVR